MDLSFNLSLSFTEDTFSIDGIIYEDNFINIPSIIKKHEKRSLKALYIS